MDPIADLGPAIHSSPDLWPVPDADWDIDDIVVFTGQATFFGDAGWNLCQAFPGSAQCPCYGRHRAAQRGSTDGRALGPVWVEVTPAGDDLYEVSARIDSESALLGARVGLRYDHLQVVSVESGGFLGGDSGQELAIPRESKGYAELGLTRLSADEPALAGSGTLASFLVQTVDEPSGTIEFELRGGQGAVVAQGSLPIVIGGGISPKVPDRSPSPGAVSEPGLARASAWSSTFRPRRRFVSRSMTSRGDSCGCSRTRRSPPARTRGPGTDAPNWGTPRPAACTSQSFA
ncbi:MAG: hypothetical protein R3E12_11645 [Candidatus Eisenbacteria bacterium]